MRDTIKRSSVCLWIGLLAMPGAAPAAEPRPEALRGFEQYVQRTEERIRTEVSGGTFLWVNALPAAQREKAMNQLRRGEAAIERMQSAPAATPGAMIHHWMGTILIPGATLERVLSTIQDYDRHREYYAPEVARSRTVRRSGDDFTIYLRLQRTKVITVAFDTEHQVRYHRPDALRAYSESRGTRIAELQDAGEAGERVLSPAEERGFLWRLNSYWRFQQAAEGVYVQCEAVSLTRNIPTGLGWLVGPFVESVPRESLEFTLRSTQAAISGPPEK